MKIKKSVLDSVVNKASAFVQARFYKDFGLFACQKVGALDVEEAENGASGSLSLLADVEGIVVPIDLVIAGGGISFKDELGTEDALRTVFTADKKAALSFDLSVAENVVTASLGDFKVEEDGSGYYRIFHPAYDQDVPFMKVSKLYSATDGLKECLVDGLKEALLKGCIAATGVKFEGEFTLALPTVVEPTCELPVEETPLAPVVAASEEDASRRAVPTSVALSVAADKQKEADAKHMFIWSALDGVQADVKKTFQDFKIDEVLSDTTARTDNGYEGHVVVAASLSYAGSRYTAPVPIVFWKNHARVPAKTEIEAALAQGVNVTAKLQEELEKQTAAKIAELDAKAVAEDKELYDSLFVDKVASIDVKAADGGVALMDDTIELEKFVFDGMDLQLGDVVCLHGQYWKLISKKVNLLSEEGESPIWRFERVPAVTSPSGEVESWG